MDFWNILKALVFGIVEGITEWLPVSSTGHMILLEEFMPFSNIEKDFWDMFLVVVQLGAIFAVIFLFWKTIWPFGLSKNRTVYAEAETKDAKVNPREEENVPFWKKEVLVVGPVALKMDIVWMWLKIVLACIPGILFVLLGLNDICDYYFYNAAGVSTALIVFGIAFILVEIWNSKRATKIESIAELTWKMALLIGVFQLLAAAFPGTSRSGATIIGALLIGVSRKTASEFTFILAIPVMLGASLLEVLDFGFRMSGEQWLILISGMVSAFLVSLFVIRFLLGYIRKHDFKVFGWYRIILGVIVLICGFFHVIELI